VPHDPFRLHIDFDDPLVPRSTIEDVPVRQEQVEDGRVQPVETRTGNARDANRALLSPAARRIYEALRLVLGLPASHERPFVRNDDEQALDGAIAAISADSPMDRLSTTHLEYRSSPERYAAPPRTAGAAEAPA
jgi:hypothetical protein